MPRMTSNRRLVAAPALLLLLLLSGLVASAPAAQAAGVRYVDEVFATVTETPDQVYGMAIGEFGLEALKYDLYEPSGDTLERRPAVVYVHGGYFHPSLGNRKSPDSLTVSRALARRGYVVISIDYRVFGGALTDPVRLARAIPAALQDSQTAVRFLRASAGPLRLHTDAIAIGGYSAGEFNAIGVSNLSANPVNPSSASSSGWRQDVAAGFAFAGSGPATVGGAPMIRFGGETDTIVPYVSQVNSCNNSKALGNICEFHSFPNTDHIQLGVLYMNSDLIPKTVDFLFLHVVPELATAPSSPLAIPRDEQRTHRGMQPGGPSIANRDGRLEVFGAGTDGTVFTTFQYAIGSGWSGFYPFPNGGVSATTEPVSTQRNDDGRLQIALLGVDGRIYQSGQVPDGNGWLPIQRLGQEAVTFASPPVLAKNADGRLEAFAVSAAGVLHHSWQDRANGDFSDWFPLAAPLLSTEVEGAIAVTPVGMSLRLFATTQTGTLVRLEQGVGVGTGWSPAQVVPGAPVGRPAAGSNALSGTPPVGVPITELIAFRQADGHLVMVRWFPGLGTGEASPASQLSTATPPAMGRNPDGRLEVFAVGTDGVMSHAWEASPGGPMSVLEPLGGSCGHIPSVVSNDDGRLEVFCLNTAGDLTHDFQLWTNGPWFGFTTLGGTLVA